MAAPEAAKRDRQKAKVAAAMEAIGPLYEAALREDTFAAWDAFEMQAATLHRQSRLLAGKKRGG